MMVLSECRLTEMPPKPHDLANRLIIQAKVEDSSDPAMVRLVTGQGTATYNVDRDALRRRDCDPKPGTMIVVTFAIWRGTETMLAYIERVRVDNDA